MGKTGLSQLGLLTFMKNINPLFAVLPDFSLLTLLNSLPGKHYSDLTTYLQQAKITNSSVEMAAFLCHRTVIAKTNFNNKIKVNGTITR